MAEYGGQLAAGTLNSLCRQHGRMNRRRAFGVSMSITVIVFVTLALPTLRALYGPQAVIMAYAAVSILAGGLTWSLLAQFVNTTADGDTDKQTTIEVVAPTTERGTVVVDGELETLREEVDQPEEG